MGRGKRGVKFPGRTNGEGRRASFSDVSVSEDPSAQNTETQLDKIQEVCSLSPFQISQNIFLPVPFRPDSALSLCAPPC